MATSALCSVSRRARTRANFSGDTTADRFDGDEAAKKSVLRHFPYGLYGITVMSEGEDHAMTANWVTQAAFDPPMVVVAIENDAKSLPMIRDARAFAVNVFAAGQRDLAAQLGRSLERDGKPLTLDATGMKYAG